MCICNLWITGNERPSTPPVKIFHKPSRSLDDFLKYVEEKKDRADNPYKKRKFNKPSEPNSGAPVEEKDITIEVHQ